MDRLRASLPQMAGIGAVVGFDLGEQGVWLVDARRMPPEFVDAETDADCLVRCSAENLMRILEGKLDPMLAYTLGKIKLKGSMGVAMKLVSAIG
ncbi:MAG TPA: sterol-binding protein [Rhodospirillaceae bacterium]|nr:sterol-binding protein [Rhodospirillaceae bacterium]